MASGHETPRSDNSSIDIDSDHNTRARVPRDEEFREHLGLVEIFAAVWQSRWLVFGVVAFAVVSAAAYSVLADRWYDVEVVLAPAETKSSEGLLGQFSGLAGLAGMRVQSQNTAESLAVLRSRNFLRQFVEEQDITKVLFAEDWDSDSKSWKWDDPDRWPDWEDAVRYLNEKVLTVSEDSKSGLVTLSVSWKDPFLAATWAESLVRRLNDDMKKDAIAESQGNLEYLEQQAGSTTVVPLQQAIGRLIESELQKSMLARGSLEFALRTIDPALPPRDPTWPRPWLLIAIAFVVGCAVGLLLALLRRSWNV